VSKALLKYKYITKSYSLISTTFIFLWNLNVKQMKICNIKERLNKSILKTLNYFVSELQKHKNIKIFDSDLNCMAVYDCNWDLQGIYMCMCLCVLYIYMYIYYIHIYIKRR